MVAFNPYHVSKEDILINDEDFCVKICGYPVDFNLSFWQELDTTFYPSYGNMSDVIDFFEEAITDSFQPHWDRIAAENAPAGPSDPGM